MALTLEQIDSLLAVIGPGIHSLSEVDRDLAESRVDYYLEKRFEVAPVHRGQEQVPA